MKRCKYSERHVIPGRADKNTSRFDQIVKLVREGATKRAPIGRVTDFLTGYFVPFITLIAILTWVWLSLGLSGSFSHHYLDNDIGGWSMYPYILHSIDVFHYTGTDARQERKAWCIAEWNSDCLRCF